MDFYGIEPMDRLDSYLGGQGLTREHPLITDFKIDDDKIDRFWDDLGIVTDHDLR
jgi:hypothetical protein